jgi:hypothetical protein
VTHVPGAERRDLTWTEVAARLTAEPFWWLATASASNGPHSVPVWGVVVDGRAFSYADATARRVRDLSDDPRTVLHLPSASDVLIVRGTLHDAGLAEEAPAVVAAYTAKYTDPRDQQWLPGAEGMEGVRLLRLEARSARTWHLDDFLGSQRAWRASTSQPAG